MGVVMLAIWAHIPTPAQSAALIVGYGLLTQSYGIWKLRRRLSWQRLAPFIIGGALGVPIGTMLLAHVAPAHLRSALGVLMILYGRLNDPAFRKIVFALLVASELALAVPEWIL